jgi:hypothetical protein
MEHHRRLCYNRSMTGDFVILHHTDYGEDHFDVMFAVGGVLRTWQLLSDPREIPVGDSISASPLPDHRLAYLSYEGPVSRDRGFVERLVAGTYEADGWESETICVELDTGPCCQTVNLHVDESGTWRWQRQA